MTKIAIPTRNNAVDNQFGQCEYYTILTISRKKQILSSECIPSLQKCGYKPNIASVLQRKGVSVMLVGTIGQEISRLFTTYKIKVVKGCSGSILDVVSRYIAGKIGGTESKTVPYQHLYEYFG